MFLIKTKFDVLMPHDILVRDGFETERLVCRFKLTFNGE